jgi:glycosyltransferase involved in cell wall biosynthesis
MLARRSNQRGIGSGTRIAIVHDWLDTWRGGESVLAEICRVYPTADLFALVDFLREADRDKLLGKRAATSFLQHFPFARSGFRALLPVFPRAIESLDVSGYDLVISSSHAVAKGVRTHRGQLHLCYCYTPMRYAWDLQDQYLEQTDLAGGVRGRIARHLLARLRRWDRAASARVDHFAAISHYIAARIHRCYGRGSTVIYPPVSVAPVTDSTPRGTAYVAVSQLVPYKRVDLLVEAFRSLPDRDLFIIGDGPLRDRIAARAGPNVHLLGRLPDAERDRWLARARAFVFAAQEDFGIAPVEAQAHGTPVIALGLGGAAETICGLESEAPTGVLFTDQTAEAIAAAVRAFEANEARVRPEACRRNAARFTATRFRQEFREFVDTRWSDFTAQAGHT